MNVSSVMMTAVWGAMAATTRYNINAVYGILVVAGIGISGIVVPASIMTTIICLNDLIATVAALTQAIRVIGGAIGYTVTSTSSTPSWCPFLLKGSAWRVWQLFSCMERTRTCYSGGSL